MCRAGRSSRDETLNVEGLGVLHAKNQPHTSHKSCRLPFYYNELWQDYRHQPDNLFANHGTENTQFGNIKLDNT